MLNSGLRDRRMPQAQSRLDGLGSKILSSSQLQALSDFSSDLLLIQRSQNLTLLGFCHRFLVTDSFLTTVPAEVPIARQNKLAHSKEFWDQCYKHSRTELLLVPS